MCKIGHLLKYSSFARRNQPDVLPTIVSAMLDNSFYLELVLDGCVRIDGYVNGRGVVGMVRRNPINEASVPDSWCTSKTRSGRH
jgi:hypothetical protein